MLVTAALETAQLGYSPVCSWSSEGRGKRWHDLTDQGNILIADKVKVLLLGVLVFAMCAGKWDRKKGESREKGRTIVDRRPQRQLLPTLVKKCVMSRAFRCGRQMGCCCHCCGCCLSEDLARKVCNGSLTQIWDCALSFAFVQYVLRIIYTILCMYLVPDQVNKRFFLEIAQNIFLG